MEAADESKRKGGKTVKMSDVMGNHGNMANKKAPRNLLLFRGNALN